MQVAADELQQELGKPYLRAYPCAAPAVRSGARSESFSSQFYYIHCLSAPVQALTTSADPVQRTCPLCAVRSAVQSEICV
jgi:hypothetical protein